MHKRIYKNITNFNNMGPIDIYVPFHKNQITITVKGNFQKPPIYEK